VRDPQEEIRKRLDEVVGTEFDERGKRWRGDWLRHSAPRWAAGIAAGIAMAWIIWHVLDHYLKAAHQRPEPSGPVMIDIVPKK
jgi:hypothetical protein